MRRFMCLLVCAMNLCTSAMIYTCITDPMQSNLGLYIAFVISMFTSIMILTLGGKDADYRVIPDYDDEDEEYDDCETEDDDIGDAKFNIKCSCNGALNFDDGNLSLYDDVVIIMSDDSYKAVIPYNKIVSVDVDSQTFKLSTADYIFNIVCENVLKRKAVVNLLQSQMAA